MAKTKLEVVKCTPSNGGKTFVWTLREDQMLFGQKGAKFNTYYIGAMKINIRDGKGEDELIEVEEDLTRFWIEERQCASIPQGADKEPILCNLDDPRLEGLESGKGYNIIKMKWLRNPAEKPTS